MSQTPPKPNGAKNPRIKLDFTDEQKAAHSLFHRHDVNFLVGKFGSGKTASAVGMAILGYRKKQIHKIWITRPITKNKLGYLPGSMQEKLDPWIFPIVHNFNMCQSPKTTQKMMEEKDIEIKPVDFMKGITIPLGHILIVDEFQDLEYDEFRLVLSRLGKGAKIIFCGDPNQVDASIKEPCVPKIKILKDSGLVGWTELKSNHRNDSLVGIFEVLDSKSKMNLDG